MTEIKYLTKNAIIALLATAAGILMMTNQENYTYLYLVVAAAIVGLRDLVAAVNLKNNK